MFISANSTKTNRRAAQLTENPVTTYRLDVLIPSAADLVVKTWQKAVYGDIYPEQQNRGIEKQRREVGSRDAIRRTIKFAEISSTG